MIMSNNFNIINKDHYICTKRSKDKFAIMLLYFDNMLITKNNKEYVNEIKEWLSSNFEMKDMGEATYIPRVKVSRDHSRKLLSLPQKPYINKILE